MNFEFKDFFYNTIPGLIYTFFGTLYFGYWSGNFEVIKSVKGNLGDTSFILLFFTFSIFLGFLLQAIWKIVRGITNIDNCIILKIKEKYGKEWKIQDKNPDEILEDVYNINSLLWSQSSQSMTEHEGFMAAFWSNVMVGSLFAIIFNILNLIKTLNLIMLIILILQLFILIISFFIYKNFRANFIKTVFRTKIKVEELIKKSNSK